MVWVAAEPGADHTGTTTSASSWISGGAKAAANPLGVRLSGLPAKAVTPRIPPAQHIPANRTRIATDWALGAIFSRQLVQLGSSVPARYH